MGSGMLAQAAAFGRLCVETPKADHDDGPDAAAAFGRLCVETRRFDAGQLCHPCSRLRAAVC